MPRKTLAYRTAEYNALTRPKVKYNKTASGKKRKRPTKAKRLAFRRVPEKSELSAMKVNQLKNVIKKHNNKVCIKLTGNKATLIRRIRNAKTVM